MNAPHVVAQQVVKPGESRTIHLHLNPWRYRIRSLKATRNCLLNVQPEGEPSEVTVTLGSTGMSPGEITSGPDVTVTLCNESDKEHTIMLERDADRGQVTTAALVTTLAEFRSLFSSEVLAPDTEVRAGTVTLMFTDLRESTSMYESIGDTSAYRLSWRSMTEHLSRP